MEASIFVSTNQIPEGFNINESISSPIKFTLDTGDDGYLLTDGQLNTMLEVAKLEIGKVSDTNFRGIKFYTLNAQGVPVTESAVFDGLPKRTGRRSRVSVTKWDGKTRDTFKKLVEKILAPAIPDTPIHMSVPHGRSGSDLAPYMKDDHFNVLIWAGYLNQKLDKSPEKMWGIKVDCMDSAFLASGDGVHPIMDGDYCVAEIFENALYIHHDVVHHGTEREWMIFRKILEETANILKNPELILAAREDRIRKNVKNYVALCAKGSSAKIEQMKRELRDAESKVEDLRENYTRTLRNRDRLMVEIPKLSELTAEGQAQFEADYKRLIEFNDVIDVKVFDDCIDIYTNDLYCVDPRSGFTHWMGKFRIRINTQARRGGVIWKNLDFVVKGYEGGMQAPHVFTNGNACLGSLEEIIPQYLAKWDFATLTQLAISFIQSVNVDDVAGARIDRWPIAECSYELAKSKGIDDPAKRNKEYIKKPTGGNGR